MISCWCNTLYPYTYDRYPSSHRRTCERTPLTPDPLTPGIWYRSTGTHGASRCWDSSPREDSERKSCTRYREWTCTRRSIVGRYTIPLRNRGDFFIIKPHSVHISYTKIRDFPEKRKSAKKSPRDASTEGIKKIWQTYPYAIKCYCKYYLTF